MFTRHLLALAAVAAFTVVGSAQQPPAQKSDPLKEAADILKALGPPPTAPRPAQVVKKHVLLEAPTAWYHHTCRTGNYGFCRYQLVVLYPDGTFGFFEESFGGTVDEKFTDPGLLLSRTTCRPRLEYAGTWEIADDGELTLKTEQVGWWVKKSPRGYRREDYADRKSKYYFATDTLRIQSSKQSEYDLQKVEFFANHFGKTVAEANEGKDLERP